MTNKAKNKDLVHGEVIGRFLDKPIYDWVEDPHGARYEFVRALTQIARNESFDMKLGADECIIMPGLLYKKAIPLEAFLPAAHSDHQFL